MHTRNKKEWAVFSGSEEGGGPRRALIYVPIEWTLFPIPERSRFAAFFNPFACLSGYSC
jgi:hypothetical protein